jgi:hypothetical protein
VTTEEQSAYVLKMLERVEIKLDALAAHDLNHAQEINTIKNDLSEVAEAINDRIIPIEDIVKNLNYLNKFAKWLFLAIMSSSAILAALSVLREKIRW